MDNKKSLMAELLDQYGYGFEHMDNSNTENTKNEESKTEETIIKEQKIELPKDITIKCKKCENDFVWSIRDQEFYKEKGFYKPTYCKDCRKKIKVVNNFHKEA